MRTSATTMPMPTIDLNRLTQARRRYARVYALLPGYNLRHLQLSAIEQESFPLREMVALSKDDFLQKEFELLKKLGDLLPQILYEQSLSPETQRTQYQKLLQAKAACIHLELEKKRKDQERRERSAGAGAESSAFDGETPGEIRQFTRARLETGADALFGQAIKPNGVLFSLLELDKTHPLGDPTSLRRTSEASVESQEEDYSDDVDRLPSPLQALYLIWLEKIAHFIIQLLLKLEEQQGRERESPLSKQLAFLQTVLKNLNKRIASLRMGLIPSDGTPSMIDLRSFSHWRDLIDYLLQEYLGADSTAEIVSAVKYRRNCYAEAETRARVTTVDHEVGEAPLHTPPRLRVALQAIPVFDFGQAITLQSSLAFYHYITKILQFLNADTRKEYSLFLKKGEARTFHQQFLSKKKKKEILTALDSLKLDKAFFIAQAMINLHASYELYPSRPGLGITITSTDIKEDLQTVFLEHFKKKANALLLGYLMDRKNTLPPDCLAFLDEEFKRLGIPCPALQRLTKDGSKITFQIFAGIFEKTKSGYDSDADLAILFIQLKSNQEAAQHKTNFSIEEGCSAPFLIVLRDFACKQIEHGKPLQQSLKNILKGQLFYSVSYEPDGSAEEPCPLPEGDIYPSLKAAYGHYFAMRIDKACDDPNFITFFELEELLGINEATVFQGIIIKALAALEENDLSPEEIADYLHKFDRYPDIKNYLENLLSQKIKSNIDNDELDVDPSLFFQLPIEKQNLLIQALLEKLKKHTPSTSDPQNLLSLFHFLYIIKVGRSDFDWSKLETIRQQEAAEQFSTQSFSALLKIYFLDPSTDFLRALMAILTQRCLNQYQILALVNALLNHLQENPEAPLNPCLSFIEAMSALVETEYDPLMLHIHSSFSSQINRATARFAAEIAMGESIRGRLSATAVSRSDRTALLGRMNSTLFPNPTSTSPVDCSPFLSEPCLAYKKDAFAFYLTKLNAPFPNGGDLNSSDQQQMRSTKTQLLDKFNRNIYNLFDQYYLGGDGELLPENAIHQTAVKMTSEALSLLTDTSPPTPVLRKKIKEHFSTTAISLFHAAYDQYEETNPWPLQTEASTGCTPSFFKRINGHIFAEITKSLHTHPAGSASSNKVSYTAGFDGSFERYFQNKVFSPAEVILLKKLVFAARFCTRFSEYHQILKALVRRTDFRFLGLDWHHDYRKMLKAGYAIFMTRFANKGAEPLEFKSTEFEEIFVNCSDLAGAEAKGRAFAHLWANLDSSIKPPKPGTEAPGDTPPSPTATTSSPATEHLPTDLPADFGANYIHVLLSTRAEYHHYRIIAQELRHPDLQEQKQALLSALETPPFMNTAPLLTEVQVSIKALVFTLFEKEPLKVAALQRVAALLPLPEVGPGMPTPMLPPPLLSLEAIMPPVEHPSSFEALRRYAVSKIKIDAPLNTEAFLALLGLFKDKLTTLSVELFQQTINKLLVQPSQIQSGNQLLFAQEHKPDLIKALWALYILTNRATMTAATIEEIRQLLETQFGYTRGRFHGFLITLHGALSSPARGAPRRNGTLFPPSANSSSGRTTAAPPSPPAADSPPNASTITSLDLGALPIDGHAGNLRCCMTPYVTRGIRLHRERKYHSKSQRVGYCLSSLVFAAPNAMDNTIVTRTQKPTPEEMEPEIYYLWVENHQIHWTKKAAKIIEGKLLDAQLSNPEAMKAAILQETGAHALSDRVQVELLDAIATSSYCFQLPSRLASNLSNFVSNHFSRLLTQKGDHFSLFESANTDGLTRSIERMRDSFDVIADSVSDATKQQAALRSLTALFDLPTLNSWSTYLLGVIVVLQLLLRNSGAQLQSTATIESMVTLLSHLTTLPAFSSRTRDRVIHSFTSDIQTLIATLNALKSSSAAAAVAAAAGGPPPPPITAPGESDDDATPTAKAGGTLANSDGSQLLTNASRPRLPAY